jgi:hypothetical protein
MKSRLQAMKTEGWDFLGFFRCSLRCYFLDFWEFGDVTVLFKYFASQWARNCVITV